MAAAILNSTQHGRVEEAAWPSGLGRWIWNLEVPGSNPPPYRYLDLFSVAPQGQLLDRIV